MIFLGCLSSSTAAPSRLGQITDFITRRAPYWATPLCTPHHLTLQRTTPHHTTPLCPRILHWGPLYFYPVLDHTLHLHSFGRPCIWIHYSAFVFLLYLDHALYFYAYFFGYITLPCDTYAPHGDTLYSFAQFGCFVLSCYIGIVLHWTTPL